ncbi:MAG: leucine zipper domain-containing protein, partial [Acidimicrobiia bacterium]
MGHSRSKLTPAGRRLLVDRILVEGWPVAYAAEMAGVSRQTAHRWVTRFVAEGEAGLVDRSSRPRSCPRRVPPVVEAAIVADRMAERDGPHLMAGRLGVARSTIYAVLRRRGLSRLSTLDRTTGVPIRYVRDHPGELVHVDTKQLARVPDGGGHRVLGRSAATKTRGG